MPLSLFEDLADGRLDRLAFEVILGAMRVRLATDGRRGHLHRGLIYVKDAARAPAAEPSEGRTLEVLRELSDPQAALRALRLAVFRVERAKHGQPPTVEPAEAADERAWDEVYAGPGFCQSLRWCGRLEEELDHRQLASAYGQHLARLTCPDYVNLSSAEEVGVFWAGLAHAPPRLRVVAALEAVANALHERESGAAGAVADGAKDPPPRAGGPPPA